MTVKELIAELAALNPDLEVFVASDEEGNRINYLDDIGIATAKRNYTMGQDEQDEYRWVGDKLFEIESYNGEEELFHIPLARTEALILWPGWGPEDLFRDA